MSWEQAQAWEKEWWGNCANTYGEEEKQLFYARKMGLPFFHNGKSPYNVDMQGARVLDIGGGPCSLLLKCVNVRGMVVDPLPVPEWVSLRYEGSGICALKARAEDIALTGFDECWIYNVLQHTENPQKVVENARKAAQLIRVFEWIDTPSNTGHPHSLTKAGLDTWLGGDGKTEHIKGIAHCWGKAYYGVFVGSG